MREREGAGEGGFFHGELARGSKWEGAFGGGGEGVHDGGAEGGGGFVRVAGPPGELDVGFVRFAEGCCVVWLCAGTGVCGEEGEGGVVGGGGDG